MTVGDRQGRVMPGPSRQRRSSAIRATIASMADPRPTEPGEHESAYELLQRGTQLLAGRHHAQAAVVLERAARLEPGKGSILEALGRAYYNSGQSERAREAFAALLDVDPSAPFAHFGLGQSLKRLGRRDEARTHLRLAVALAPDSAVYHAALERLGPDPRHTA
jgi:tetratricopeptide (TPR) repeat protein